MYFQERSLPLAGEATLQFDHHVDAPAAEVSQEEAPRDARAVWPGLVARVRRGDPRAAADLARLCRPGVRLLLKLNLSAVGLDRIVEETIAGALDEIRRGWIREPRDLSAFVRTVIERLAPAPGSRGASDQARARRRSSELETALRVFPPAEQTWLRRFYIEGWEAAQVIAASGMSEAEFSELRRRLRQQAGLPGYSVAPKETLRVRRAAAGEHS